VVPHYSPFLDRLNWSAHWAATVRRNRKCPKFDTREAMYQYIHDQYLGGPDQPIDYLEFGVYQGESIKCWAAMNPHAASRFVGFDSFQGLPEDWTRQNPAGAFDVGGEIPVVDDARVRFVVGWFQQSVPAFLTSYQPANRLVIHNDSDLYSSTLYTLTALDAVMPPETLIIFDEFYDPLHEYRALEDYTSAYARTYEIVAATRNYVQAVVKVV
jgi:O-methyltransferase